MCLEHFLRIYFNLYWCYLFLLFISLFFCLFFFIVFPTWNSCCLTNYRKGGHFIWKDYLVKSEIGSGIFPEMFRLLCGTLAGSVGISRMMYL